MKPKFDDLPWCIRERLLWDMELGYDPYESSQAEVINDISNGHVNRKNRRIIDEAYASLTEDALYSIAQQERETARLTIDRIGKLIDGLLDKPKGI